MSDHEGIAREIGKMKRRPEGRHTVVVAALALALALALVGIGVCDW